MFVFFCCVFEQKLTAEIEEVRRHQAEAEAQSLAATRKSEALERQIREFESEKKNKMMEIEQELAVCKKKVASSNQVVKKQQQQVCMRCMMDTWVMDAYMMYDGCMYDV